jgi:hypothetical protein
MEIRSEFMNLGDYVNLQLYAQIHVNYCCIFSMWNPSVPLCLVFENTFLEHGSRKKMLRASMYEVLLL